MRTEKQRSAGCYDWAIDDAQTLSARWVEPCEDVPRTVQVTVKAMPARAGEVPSRALADSPAGGAGLAGVSRVHEHDFHAPLLGFVRQELAELEESPSVQKPVEPSSSTVFSDSREVFQRDDAACVESSDNLLCDQVIHFPHKEPLPPANPPEMAFRGLRAFRLEATPQSLHPVEDLGYSLKELVVAGDCQVVHSEVDADVVNRTDRISLTGGGLSGDDHMQPQATFKISDQLRAHHHPAHIASVVRGECEGVFASAVDGREAANAIAEPNPIAFATRVTDAQILSELGFATVQGERGFDGSSNFADARYRQVGGESSALADVFVDEPMQSEAVALFALPGDRSNLVGCRRVLAERVHERGVIGQPDFQRPVHDNLSNDTSIKTKGGERCNSPPFKNGGPLATLIMVGPII